MRCDDGFFGFRQYASMQGIPLFRSRELDSIDEEGVQQLLRLGITDIFDLRKEAERSNSCLLRDSPLRVHVLACDLQGDQSRTQRSKARNITAAYGPPGSRMRGMYSSMAAHIDAIEALVSAIISIKNPTLVHCANGKDRAGVVCACIMAALGYSEAQIMQEYLYTNTVNRTMNDHDIKKLSETLTDSELLIMRSLFEAREEYLSAFFHATKMNRPALHARSRPEAFFPYCCDEEARTAAMKMR